MIVMAFMNSCTVAAFQRRSTISYSRNVNSIYHVILLFLKYIRITVQL